MMPRYRAAVGAVLFVGLAFAAAEPAKAQFLVKTKDPNRPLVQYQDSLISLNDRCIVRGATLNPIFKPVYVNGKPIGFCCRTCPGVFVLDPEPYLRAQNIEVYCMVYPKRKARIDSSLRRRIGHDLFYFSTGQAMRQFDRDPLRYVKRLSDPITSDRFRVTRASPHSEYKNRTYYFASDGEQRIFGANQEKFRDRRATPSLDADD